MASKIISMCVVPIKITHAETKRKVSTFAMLDNCSQGSFIKNNIIEKPGASGRKREIIRKALNGDQEVASIVISRLTVASDMEGVTKHGATYQHHTLGKNFLQMLKKWQHETSLQNGSTLKN